MHGMHGSLLSQYLIFWLTGNTAVTQWGLSLPLSHRNLFLQSTCTMLQSLAGKQERESTSGSVQAWPPNWDGRRSVRVRNWKAEGINPGLFLWALFVAKCRPRQSHTPQCCWSFIETRALKEINSHSCPCILPMPSSQVREVGNWYPRASLALMEHQWFNCRLSGLHHHRNQKFSPCIFSTYSRK